jgi:hypothetical protein
MTVQGGASDRLKPESAIHGTFSWRKFQPLPGDYWQ